jgi:SAM-dependent methyltransferase
MTPGHALFRCPDCRSPLRVDAGTLRCDSCERGYPVTGGVADFSGGAYYDQFTPGDALDPEHERNLAAEEGGARWRIERFYGPLLPPGARVLDCGCGNGVSVDVLNDVGWDAWGIDLSALRRWQWRERRFRDRLAVASAMSLPFPDEAFDVVMSCGLIEHIGVAETGGATYSVRPLADRDAQRQRLIAEMLRVVKPGGVVYIDCPNGAFPIDFWHNATGGKPRFHSTREGFLPTYSEIASLAGAAGAAETSSLSPYRRFAFRQVGRYWFGRLLAPLVTAWLFALRWPLVRVLSRSPLNPYLVVKVVKPPTGPATRPSAAAAASPPALRPRRV